MGDEWSAGMKRSMEICTKIIDILLLLSQGEVYVKSNVGSEAIIKGTLVVVDRLLTNAAVLHLFSSALDTKY